MATIQIHKDVAEPTLSGGGDNPHWKELVNYVMFGAKIRKRGNVVTIRRADLSLSQLNTLMGDVETTFGAGSIEVDGVAAWIRATTTASNRTVPAWLPVPEIVESEAVLDDDGNVVAPAVTRRPKYKELRMARQDGSYWYAPAADRRNYLPGTILRQLQAESGITIVNAPPAQESPEP
jgi:hypothetical protein